MGVEGKGRETLMHFVHFPIVRWLTTTLTTTIGLTCLTVNPRRAKETASQSGEEREKGIDD